MYTDIDRFFEFVHKLKIAVLFEKREKFKHAL